MALNYKISTKNSSKNVNGLQLNPQPSCCEASALTTTATGSTPKSVHMIQLFYDFLWSSLHFLAQRATWTPLGHRLSLVEPLMKLNAPLFFTSVALISLSGLSLLLSVKSPQRLLTPVMRAHDLLCLVQEKVLLSQLEWSFYKGTCSLRGKTTDESDKESEKCLHMVQILLTLMILHT